MVFGVVKIAYSVIALVNVLMTANANVKLNMSPTGTVYLFSGNWSVNFTCVLESKGDDTNEITSSNLTFYLSIRSQAIFQKLPDNCTNQINSTMLVLKRCQEAEVNKGNSVFISCRLKNNVAIMSDEATVTVNDRHPPPEIPLAEAEVVNWDGLKFKVNTGEDPSRMLELKYEVLVCKDSTSSNCNNCKYTKINDSMLEVTVENPFQISGPANDLIIKVNGEATRAGIKTEIETSTSEEVRLNLNQFVKPAQVNNIEVQKLESSVRVSFEPPKLNRNITYNVVVKCDADSNNHSVNVTRQINCPPNNETRRSNNNIETNCRVSKELTDLPAFSSCTASVRAVSVAGGRWSDWKSQDFETPESVPRRNPEICSNCFSIRQGISHSESDVIIYFIPLSKKEAQGKIILYKIRILDKSSSNEIFQYFNNTESNRYSLILRNLSHYRDYEIGIEAKTSKGYYSGSPNISKAIAVPLSHVRSISCPKNFVVIRLNYTAVRASWYLDESVCDTDMTISLFWCEGHFQDKTCTNVLKRKNISSEVTSDIIAYSGGDSIFGILTDCDGNSSGILWNKCLYDLDKNPEEPNIQSIVPSYSHATVVFEYASECSLGSRPGLTVSYRVSYCEILPNESYDDNDCVSSETTILRNRSYNNTLTVDGLSQNKRYRLSIWYLSENNKSSKAVIKTFVTETHAHFNLAALSAVAVIAGLLLVAALTIAALKCRAHILDFKYVIPEPFRSPKITVRKLNSPTLEADDDCSNSSYGGAVNGIYQRVDDDDVDDDNDLSAPRNELCSLKKRDTERVERISALQLEVMGVVSHDPGDRGDFLVSPKSVTVVTIPGSSRSDTLNCQNLSSEVIDDDACDASRILPPVFVRPSDNAVETDTKVTLDEQRCQQMPLHEHQEPSAVAYSPSTSDYVSENDEYMCVAHGNPESSKLEKVSSVPDDSSGYIDGSARVDFAFEPSPPTEPKQPDFDVLASDSSGVQQSRDSIPAAVGGSGADCTEAEPREDGIYSFVALENRVNSLVSEEDEGIDSLREEGSLAEKPDRTSAGRKTRQSSMQPSGSSDFDDDPDSTGVYAGGPTVPESVLPVVGAPLVDEYCSGFQQTGGGDSVCSEWQPAPLSDSKGSTAGRPLDGKGYDDDDEEAKDPSCPGLSTAWYRTDALFTCPTDCNSVSESILPPILLLT